MSCSVLFCSVRSWAWTGRSKFLSCLWRMEPRWWEGSFNLNYVLLSQWTKQKSIFQLNNCLLSACYMGRSNGQEKELWCFYACVHILRHHLYRVLKIIRYYKNQILDLICGRLSMNNGRKGIYSVVLGTSPHPPRLGVTLSNSTDLLGDYIGERATWLPFSSPSKQ